MRGETGDRDLGKIPASSELKRQVWPEVELEKVIEMDLRVRGGGFWSVQCPVGMSYIICPVVATQGLGKVLQIPGLPSSPRSSTGEGTSLQPTCPGGPPCSSSPRTWPQDMAETAMHPNSQPPTLPLSSPGPVDASQWGGGSYPVP